MRWIAKLIYFRVLGWKVNGTFPEIEKCIVVVVPHTSWVDFIIGVLIRSIIQKQIHFIGKKSLFRPPFGWYFKWMGGTPIDRSKRSDTVSAVAEIFDQRATFRLALSPEGTRKKVTQWKTGFYYIARTAKVPIVLVAFDYGRKEIKFSEPQYTTKSKFADFEKYTAFFKGVVGKVSHYSY